MTDVLGTAPPARTHLDGQDGGGRLGLDVDPQESEKIPPGVREAGVRLISRGFAEERARAERTVPSFSRKTRSGSPGWRER